jgi:tetratricopeptide (TPR) repeat protein
VIDPGESLCYLLSAVAKNINRSINRKELKQPDQFVSFWTRFSTQLGALLAARKKPVLIGVGALAGIVTATLIYGEIREHAAIRSSQALAHVEKTATAELTPEGGAPKDPTAKSDDLPHFKSDKERLEAALKEVNAFLSAEPLSPLRREGLLHKAGFLLDLQRPDEAIPIYADLLGSRLEKNLRFLAQEGLGYAYEAKGDLDKALAAFAALGEAPQQKTDGTARGGFYQDRALYHQARIAERKGDAAGALKLYKEVLEKTPTTSLRDEISNRLAVLEPK